MLKTRPAILIVFSISIVTLAGCQAASTGDVGFAPSNDGRQLVPSLVTVDEDRVMAWTGHGWEAARNDPPDLPRATPDRAKATFVEVWHREHLRTTSGRPREHTVTRTRSIQRHGQRR